jgi:hypothetical protein
MRNMKMLQTLPGSPDGASVETYLEGSTYPLPDVLADLFERDGVAVEVPEGTPASAHAEAGAAGKDPARMTRKELADYGKSRFGAAFTLEASAKKADLIAEIDRLAP